MLDVLLAPTAILRDVQSVRIVLFVFHARVVTAFAFAASQRDDDSIVFLSHVSKPLTLLFSDTKNTEQKDPLPGVKYEFYRLISICVNKTN
jgi:hypothetical protein